MFVCRLYAPTSNKLLSRLMLLSMSLHDRLQIWLMQTVLPTAQLVEQSSLFQLNVSTLPCRASSWVFVHVQFVSPRCCIHCLQHLQPALQYMHTSMSTLFATQHVKACVVIKSCSLHCDNTMFRCCFTYIHCEFAAIYTARV